MATIKDVAQLAGVSLATVSRVLNNSPKASQTARDAVTRAMQQLDYRPNANAQALAQKNPDTIGVVVSDVSDPFFGSLVKAVEQVATPKGKFLLIGNGYHTAEKERAAIEHLIRHRCGGLVVHSKALGDDELASYMAQVPSMVLINRSVKLYESRCIAINNQHGAWLATRHLLQEGHIRIGFIGSQQTIDDASDRLLGYQQALEESGIKPTERWVVSGSPDELGGEKAMIELLERGQHLTAVVCYNDPMAAGALSVLDDNGIRVPQQLSVVGFDDLAVARYLSPKLTTVRYPIAIMASQAAELAMALSEGATKLPHVTHMVSPVLVRRHSVSPLNDEAIVANIG